MANSNPNQDNLISFEESNSDRTVIEIQKAGGIASGEARRKTRSYKELFDTLQNKSVSKDQTIDIYKEDSEGVMKLVKISLIDFVRNKFPDIPENEIDNAIFAATKMIDLINHPKAEVAMKAFEIIRDTSGQKPTDKLDIKTDPNDIRNTVLFTQSEVDKLDKEELISLLKADKRIVVITDEELEAERESMLKELEDD